MIKPAARFSDIRGVPLQRLGQPFCVVAQTQVKAQQVGDDIQKRRQWLLGGTKFIEQPGIFRPVVVDSAISLFLPKQAQLLEKGKGGGEDGCDKPDGAQSLGGVVEGLDHFLQQFEPAQVVKRKAGGGKDLIGGLAAVADAVLFSVPPQAGAFEELEEAELQLVRLQPVDVVKRPAKGIIIFQRKPGDQVEMQVDIAPTP